MTKRRTVVDANDGVTREEVSEAGRVLSQGAQPPPAEPGPEAGYTIGSWKGHKQWRCNLCPFDTLDGERAMLEHIAAKHAPPPPVVQAYDARGHPI
jgi:hypothetical protein